MIARMTGMITAIGCVCILGPACNNATAPESQPSTGTLVFDYRVANSLAKAAVADTHTCKIVDIKATLYAIEVASGTVQEGGTDSLDWTSIYESTTEMRASERVFPPVALPVGAYNCFRIKQKNRVWWVCALGQDTIELPDLNASDRPPDTLSAINVFSDGGCFTYDSIGTFTLMTANEKLGGFEIRAAQTTNLTVTVNFNTLDWIDSDSSGTWTDGDDLDNWTAVAGKTTMVDFDVQYLP
jgi:hypothetical protein